VLDTVNRKPFLDEIARKGEKLRSIILGWKHPKVKDIRGRGLMVAADIEDEAWPLLERAAAMAGAATPGLLALSAGKNTLRFLPPYIISDAELEQGLEILRGLLG
jgi:acetylornithine/N-succinyldiaminopimelate aminotransferase